MLRIQKKLAGTIYETRLTGAVTEQAEFSSLFGDISNELHVHCQAVSRLNSNGIRSWHLYFEDLRARGISLKFFACSPALIASANYISGMLRPDEIISLCLPYVCDACKADHESLVTTAQLRETDFAIPSAVCPDCEGEMELDVSADQHFSLLKIKARK